MPLDALSRVSQMAIDAGGLRNDKFGMAKDKFTHDQTKDMSDTLLKDGFTETWTAMRDLEDSLAPFVTEGPDGMVLKENLEGVGGLLNLRHFGGIANLNENNPLRTKVRNYANRLLKIISGAQVTPSEEARQQIGMGLDMWNSDEQFVNAMNASFKELRSRRDVVRERGTGELWAKFNKDGRFNDGPQQGNDREDLLSQGFVQYQDENGELYWFNESTGEER